MNRRPTSCPEWIRYVNTESGVKVLIHGHDVGTLTAREAERFASGVEAGLHRIAELDEPRQG